MLFKIPSIALDPSCPVSGVSDDCVTVTPGSLAKLISSILFWVIRPSPVVHIYGGVAKVYDILVPSPVILSTM